MRVLRVSISRDKLLATPPAERALFLALGHLSNEITALNKLMLWASETTPRNDAESDGRLAIVLILIRILTGKLKEGWELLRKAHFGSAVSRTYHSQLPPEGKEAIDRIKEYFSSKNLVSEVRDSFSFHYPSRHLDEALPRIPESLHMYMEEGGTSNNLYYHAELAAANAMLALAVTDEDPIGYLRLHEEVATIARQFALATDHLMTLFVRLYGRTIWEGPPEEVTFGTLPRLLDVRIPWFTDPSDAYDGSA